jgi:hypothetical protein
MGVNLFQFTQQVELDATEMYAALVKFHRAVHLEALKRIIKRTPVDLGTARSSWMSTIGLPASGDTKQASAVNQGIAVLASLAPFQTTWITNNLEYISYLEYGEFEPPDPGPSKDRRKGRKGRILVKGGYSVQAPQGMVGITVDELRPLVQP